MITRNHRHISFQTLCEPATSPPLGFMTIQTPYSPWTIKIHAFLGPYITLEDIFCAIYRSLRTSITLSEFYWFSSQSSHSYATRAYKQRYRRHSSSRVYEEEKRHGMKRVDFLLGHSSFLGISNTCCQLNKWQLNVHRWPIGSTKVFRLRGILRRSNHLPVTS
ncbi:hypothetical protein GALMADRAFT_77945 [Galerina marginata CBS 339.88]|uniref:DUF6699 domain-containing protein n=1 Tax=Galerina marginata (strain CBS 339.88) TaxID=685588 RepID=A0A067SDM0_GALM3|nr:hypothetical protein GALMADRAFT_77945 [Galerina marginata CBS 339.88]